MPLQRKTPLKRGEPLTRTSPLPKRRKPLSRAASAEKRTAKRKRQQKRARERWERDFGMHSVFVKSFGCEVCKTIRNAESHHDPSRGRGGDKKKQVCLCAEHHREGPDARHRIGKKRFEAKFGIDLEARADFLWSISPFNPANAG